MAPTVVLPLPDRPATIRIMGQECSRATMCSTDPEVVESFQKVRVNTRRKVLKSGGGLSTFRKPFRKKATAMPFTRPRHGLRWLIGAIVLLVVLGLGGPFLYIHFFNGSTPTALSLSPASGAASASSSPGSTVPASTAASGSVAG